ncbi:hypothetical protein I907_gp12 [Bacillus phage Eoghan]|uniref:Uncharacterized protein n=2 Tax=Andromedavirus TaxID=1623275 RepID=M1IQI2_9CAUD|nr:hypothetical protein I907_gp12 [Bacillus phage Eoghan]YP_009592245.1 hypothetical protein FDG68_gp12 [Bacillus phage Taylor]AGE60776.1 hypothetical protein EOGHAN_12 [Bacillus phage Eoghan]AGE60930.1 hypothetical protein TAYLOR_12 [Bacillus phage Taylor]
MSKLKVILIVFAVCLFLGAISKLFGVNNETAKTTEEPKQVETKKEKAEPAAKSEPTQEELDIMNDSFSRIVNDSEGVVSSIDLKDSGFVYVTVKESVWAVADKSEKESFLAGVHQRVKMSMAGANVIKPRDSVLTKFVNEYGDVLAEKKLYGDNFKIKR